MHGTPQCTQGTSFQYGACICEAILHCRPCNRLCIIHAHMSVPALNQHLAMPCCYMYCSLEHPAVTARTDDEIMAYRAKRQIHVYGDGVPKPVTTFEEASFPGAAAQCCVIVC